MRDGDGAFRRRRFGRFVVVRIRQRQVDRHHFPFHACGQIKNVNCLPTSPPVQDHFRNSPPSVPLPLVRPPFMVPPFEVDVAVTAAVVDEEVVDVSCGEFTAGEDRFELVLDDIDALPPPPPPPPSRSPLLS